MKINPNAIPGTAPKPVDPKTKAAGVKQAAPAPAQVDKIEIGAVQEMGTGQFVESLKAQILKEVKAGVSQSELAELRNQIAGGEYELGISEIARRILCDFD